MKPGGLMVSALIAISKGNEAPTIMQLFVMEPLQMKLLIMLPTLKGCRKETDAGYGKKRFVIAAKG